MGVRQKSACVSFTCFDRTNVSTSLCDNMSSALCASFLVCCQVIKMP